MIGPVDVYIIGFPGNQFTGRIAPAILDLIDKGIIRVMDLLFVTKDADGKVSSVHVGELDEHSMTTFMDLTIMQPGMLDQADAVKMAADLPPNSSALLIAIENAWARDLASALIAADAKVLNRVHIPVHDINTVT